MSETPAEAWSRCKPYIESALDHAGGGYAIEDVEAGIGRGEFHFWPGSRAAVVTEFWTAPRLKTLNLWLMGGDLRELRTMYRHIEAWAKANGCGRIVGGAVVGREGWVRALGVDAEPRWTIYAKELG